MPAKSKSQQRLFGMVHAYNKGEFHGPRGLRARLARLSRHISDEDASHFAQTPHEGLPEKKAVAQSNGAVLDIGMIPFVLERAIQNKRRRRMLDMLYRLGRSEGQVTDDERNAARQLFADQILTQGRVDGFKYPKRLSSDIQAAYFGDQDTPAVTTKNAQAYLRPDQANELAAFLSAYAQPVGSMTRSARRRSFLSRVIPGILIGATVGGVGAGGLGAYVAGKAARSSNLPQRDISEKVREAALHAGLWGAGHGAAIGGATGIGLGVLDKLRGQ